MDEADFLEASPTLDLFLTGNGRGYVIRLFKVGQLCDVVFPGEARNTLGLVFVDAAHEVVGYADVEVPGCAGHDVDVVLPGLSWRHGGQPEGCGGNGKGTDAEGPGREEREGGVRH